MNRRVVFVCYFYARVQFQKRLETSFKNEFLKIMNGNIYDVIYGEIFFFYKKKMS